MRFYVGTSGYSYPEWKGAFYPEKLPAKQMLGYYAQRFSTVEVNYTFKRIPSLSAVESWREQVPDSFRFALKAPQAITHRKRLKDAAEETDSFLRAAAALKERQGPLLFQLHPAFKKDLPRLATFLGYLGHRAPSAFEFRHKSWFDDDVFDVLRANSCAICVADSEEKPVTTLVSTANWGYLRLRSEGYTDKQLRHWIDRVKAQDWNAAYVFFKHEDTGSGPKLADRFLKLAAA